MNESPANLAQFFGRLHLVLLHLPVGIVLLLVALELLALVPRFRPAAASAPYIAFLAVPATALTAVCGWLLAEGGGYEGVLVERHRWLGVGVACGAVVTWLLLLTGARGLYRFSLAGTAVVLTVASHFGGSLTHGEDFLTRYAPEPLRSWPGRPSAGDRTTPGVAAGKSAFELAVRPVLDQYCLACHGAEKAKGGLRVDSVEALLKGGEAGPAIVAGRSAESLLIQRLLLPIHHDDHMPPEGKPQPTADQVALLRWWVDAGAPADKTLQELEAPAHILRVTQTNVTQTSAAETESKSGVAAAAKPLDEAMAAAQAIMEEVAITISPIAAGEPWLQCNASLAGQSFGDAELARLAPVAGNLRWLDLGGTRVTDTGAVHLAGMPHLQRLHLNNTQVTDDALTNLTGLRELTYLNLHHTRITDHGLAHLERLPALRQLYLWQSQATPAGAARLAERRTDKAQIESWRREIAALEARIQQQVMLVNTGSSVGISSAKDASPINTECPVSGKPVDRAKTTLYGGKVVAFCCDQCKAAFEKDPKPHLGKLGLTPATEAASPK